MAKLIEGKLVGLGGNIIEAEFVEVNTSLTAQQEIEKLLARIDTVTLNARNMIAKVDRTNGMAKASVKMELNELQDSIEELGWKYMDLKEHMPDRQRIIMKARLEVAYDGIENAKKAISRKRKTILKALGF